MTGSACGHRETRARRLPVARVVRGARSLVVGVWGGAPPCINPGRDQVGVPPAPQDAPASGASWGTGANEGAPRGPARTRGTKGHPGAPTALLPSARRAAGAMDKFGFSIREAPTG